MHQKKERDKILICTRHDAIMDICDAALKIMKGNANLTREDKKILKEQIKDIKLHTRHAKLDGQSMESRLGEYKSRIESLGFERVRK